MLPLHKIWLLCSIEHSTSKLMMSNVRKPWWWRRYPRLSPSPSRWKYRLWLPVWPAAPPRPFPCPSWNWKVNVSKEIAVKRISTSLIWNSINYIWHLEFLPRFKDRHRGKRTTAHGNVGQLVCRPMRVDRVKVRASYVHATQNQRGGNMTLENNHKLRLP